ncbi:MAG: hypothetical protein ABIQ62_02905 [Thermomonas sp.]
MSWDPFQREVLAELGHVLYRQAGVEIVADVDVAGVDGALLDERMLARLATAAGMSVDGLQARLQDLQAITGLRGDAAAKRALWPRLRALRRQGA